METKFLEQVIAEIDQAQRLFDRADEILRRFESEPLLASLYATPQSAPHHAEGPTVRHHLRLILVYLFAILDGSLRLREIEEFARLKGYEDEIQEMETTIKENAATFEVFALVHDLGKQFRATENAAGEFHYYGHEKDIYRLDAQQLLSRLALTYRLSDRDLNLLVPLISYHLEPLRRFSSSADPKHLDVFTQFATEHGLDADDYIDSLQAAVLLDQIFGSRQGQPLRAAPTTDTTHLVNFFVAEREWAPWKIAAKEKERAFKRRQVENKIFHEVGLDGEAIMKLTSLRASKQLGQLLKSLQAAGRGEGEMPELDRRYREVIRSRVEAARGKIVESRE